MERERGGRVSRCPPVSGHSIDWSLPCWTLYNLNWLRSECWGSAGAGWSWWWLWLFPVSCPCDQTWQTFSRALYLSSNPCWSAVVNYHILLTPGVSLTVWQLCSVSLRSTQPLQPPSLTATAHCLSSLSLSLSLWPRLRTAEAVRAAVLPGAILQDRVDQQQHQHNI